VRVPLEPEVAQPEPFACPRIRTRDEWDASPTRSNHSPMGQITRMTIHHEGMGTFEDSSIAAVRRELRTIQKSHQGFRNWADIAYHFIIDPEGRVWEGRPLKYQGAHAGNHNANKGNIGIVVMGNFDVQEPTPEQVDSLRRLVRHFMNEYDIPLSKVYTHREINDLYGRGYTACPGKNLQREVTSMRRSFAEAEAAKD